MCSANDFYIVISVELFNYITSEEIACSSGTQAPAFDFYNDKYEPSGSDHIKSHMAPSWGTSTFLSIALISNNIYLLRQDFR